MPFKLANVKCEQWRKGTLWLVIWSIVSCVNCSYCGNILKKDLTVIFTTMNSLFHFDLCTMKNSRFEETCIRQTARTCFQYGNAFIPEGSIVLCLLSWPLSDIIGNNNGKPDIMTTKSNHCQHLNCAIQIGNVECEQWREGTLWLVIWSIVICVRIL